MMRVSVLVSILAACLSQASVLARTLPGHGSEPSLTQRSSVYHFSKRDMLSPDIDPFVKLSDGGRSELVALDRIKAAETLTAMIGEAWARKVSFHGYEASEATTDAFRLRLSPEDGQDWWSHLQGFVGIAAMQKLISDTIEGRGETWKGPFNYDVFLQSDIQSKTRIAKLEFLSHPAVPDPVTSQPMQSSWEIETGISPEVAVTTSSTNSSLTEQDPLGIRTRLMLKVLEARGDWLTAQEYIHLVFEALRVPIWQNQLSSTMIFQVYPFDEKVELTTVGNYRLYVKFLRESINGDALTFGSLHAALYNLLLNPPQVAIGECVISVRPRGRELPFMNIMIEHVDGRVDSAFSGNFTGFRQSKQQVAAEVNKTVLIS